MPDVGHGVAQRAAAERLSRADALTLLGIAIVAAGYAVLAWDRRWITDDALIIVRTVRQILEGNGPTFNVFERAEPTTSALWMWLVAAAGWITGGEVAPVAVALGGGLAVLGLVIALDATRRFHRSNGSIQLLIPAGVLVVLAVFPFWDFATSGLETGLCMFWLAVIWWLVVTLRPDSGRRLQVFAVVVGLGPLVRPDFGLATLVFLIAGWLVVRPSWRRTLACAGLAIAIPLAYEVFRAGYYGTLVPLPALAKSASDSDWGHGLRYFRRFYRPHLLYVPFGLLAIAALTDRRTGITRNLVVLAAPIVTAVLLALFVVRVGGDFMHGRMFLPPTLLLLAPVLVLPLRRLVALVMIPLLAWAIFIGVSFYTGTRRVGADERAGWVSISQHRNPVREADYTHLYPHLFDAIAKATREHRPLLFSQASDMAAASPEHGALIAGAFAHLGVGGAIVPLDGITVDTFGLANPMGARITRTQPGKAGHEKNLPWEWVLADYAVPGVTMWCPPRSVDAARHALHCGDIAELLASVREPLTAERFWDNLTGSVRRTRLVIPSDPLDAERAFCAP
jgi:arabinofuranosyltransferase